MLTARRNLSAARYRIPRVLCPFNSGFSHFTLQQNYRGSENRKRVVSGQLSRHFRRLIDLPSHQDGERIPLRAQAHGGLATTRAYRL